jgi:hypothetical protein
MCKNSPIDYVEEMDIRKRRRWGRREIGKAVDETSLDFLSEKRE